MWGVDEFTYAISTLTRNIYVPLAEQSFGFDGDGNGVGRSDIYTEWICSIQI